jgi:hypothetical protein
LLHVRELRREHGCWQWLAQLCRQFLLQLLCGLLGKNKATPAGGIVDSCMQKGAVVDQHHSSTHNSSKQVGSCYLTTVYHKLGPAGE